MSPRTQFIVLAVVYSSVFFGTIWWSGKVTEKTTLYDRHIVQLEGTAIASNDVDRSVRFYAEVLDFSPIKKKGQIVGFLLPGNQKIFLFARPQFPEDQGIDVTRYYEATTLFLRVKNGFKKLHQKIAAKSGQPVVALQQANDPNNFNDLPRGTVSTILQQPWGVEFAVKDFDDNVVVFFRHRRFSRSRY